MKLWSSINHFTKSALLTIALSFAGPIGETFAQDPFTAKWQNKISSQDNQEQTIRNKLWKELYNYVDDICRISCKMMSDKVINTPKEIEELKDDMKNIMRKQTKLFFYNNNQDELARAFSFLSAKYKKNLPKSKQLTYERNVDLINSSIK